MKMINIADLNEQEQDEAISNVCIKELEEIADLDPSFEVLFGSKVLGAKTLLQEISEKTETGQSYLAAMRDGYKYQMKNTP